MATSETYLFDPKVQECFDEAYERGAGMDPATMDLRHLISMRRSLNLILRELSGQGLNLWAVREYIDTPAIGDNSLTLPAGTIDVMEAVTRDSQNHDTPMVPLSRSEWIDIPDKTIQGSRPDSYWVERLRDARTFHFYQAVGTPALTIVMNVLYQLEDVGDESKTLDVDGLWFDAICASLAARVAEKWKPERLAFLGPSAERAVTLAKQSNREMSGLSIRVSPSYGRRRGRR